jgi:hypothetical protein
MVKRVLIRLTAGERQLLVTKVQLPAPLRAAVDSAQEAGGDWGFTVSQNEAGEIRDCCGDALAEIGFDQHYAPKEAGLLLESMIDKFFVE